MYEVASLIPRWLGQRRHMLYKVTAPSRIKTLSEKRPLGIHIPPFIQVIEIQIVRPLVCVIDDISILGWDEFAETGWKWGGRATSVLNYA